MTVVDAAGTVRVTGDAWCAGRRLFYVRGRDGVVAVRCSTDADVDAVGAVLDGLAGKVRNEEAVR